jgi:hypothetical protein
MRQRRARKPPDPSKWDKVISKFMEREEALGTKRSYIERLLRLPIPPKLKRYMMLVLQAAMILARKQPMISLPQTKWCVADSKN